MFHFVSFMKQMGNIKAKWAERVGCSGGGIGDVKLRGGICWRMTGWAGTRWGIGLWAIK